MMHRVVSKQKGNIALVMVVVLMTMGLILVKSLHYYQQRAQDELDKEIKYYETFNRAESALSWGMSQSWELSTDKEADWECKQGPTRQWQSCLRHYKGTNFVLLGQSNFSQEETITVYRWVTLLAESEQLQVRGKGWLDYCPVKKKGFCL